MTNSFEGFFDFWKSLIFIRRTPMSMALCLCPFVLGLLLFDYTLIISQRHLGGVVSNTFECAAIGKEILNDHGSVVDAAIATLLCEGVNMPARAGIGGGFTAIMYVGGTFDTISATVTVPKNFIRETFANGKVVPANASGVPGELLGYWNMHQKYGVLEWKRLFKPAIELCMKNHMRANKTYTDVFELSRDQHLQRLVGPQNRTYFYNYLALKRTLEELGNNGVKSFYSGILGKTLLEDVRDGGGILTEDDLRSYTVKWEKDPIGFSISRNADAFTTPLPSAGAVVALAINIVKRIPTFDRAFFWHQVIEALKFAYGRSYGLADIYDEPNDTFAGIVNDMYTNMIDPDYAAALRYLLPKSRAGSQKEFKYYNPSNILSSFTSSTENICVLGTDGDAIVISTTTLARRGALFYSPRTGIILNNAMKSFRAFDGMQALFGSLVRPGRRPISAHCPTIVRRKTSAKITFLVGASGQETAPAQVVTALINYFILKMGAYDAVNSHVLKPNLFNGTVGYLKSLEWIGSNISDILIRMGHVFKPIPTLKEITVTNGIGNTRSNTEAVFSNKIEGNSEVIFPNHELNLVAIIIIFVIFCTVTVFCAYEIVTYTF